MSSINDYKEIRLPVFFLDETGLLNKKDDPFFALGVIRTERPHELQREIRIIRDKAHYYEEIKWTKMSPLKFDICKSIIESFMKNRFATFSCIILKKQELDFQKYFQGDLNRVYKSFSVTLLKNNINISPQEICTVIADDYFYPVGTNLELASRAIINDHYKKLIVACFLQINSKASDLLQLADLLLGATIYDLKLSRNFIKKHENLKSKTLDFLHKELSVQKSFFMDKKGMEQDRFLTEKFKVSIFKPSEDNSNNTL